MYGVIWLVAHIGCDSLWDGVDYRIYKIGPKLAKEYK